jgi:hypothetical protein
LENTDEGAGEDARVCGLAGEVADGGNGGGGGNAGPGTSAGTPLPEPVLARDWKVRADVADEALIASDVDEIDACARALWRVRE